MCSANFDDDFMVCTICGLVAPMAVATHYDAHAGCVVLCCWVCRNHHKWKLDARGLITIEEWFTKNNMTSNKLMSSYDQWLDEKEEDKTQPGGFVIDPNFKNNKP